MPISSATIKFISSLRRKKIRQNYHKFVAEGGRIVEELLGQSRYICDGVYAVEGWIKEQGLENDPRVTVVSERELSRLSQLTTPNQVLAVVHQPELPVALPGTLASGWSMYLDGIQSPANLGALLRIADWFGLEHVIGGPGTADLYNAKSIQASMGSFLRINYREGSLAEVKANFPELPLLGADLRGQDIYSYQAPAAGLLVIGAEGPGVREETRGLIDGWLTIPRGAGRVAESLNAAVAAGILVGGVVMGARDR